MSATLPVTVPDAPASQRLAVGFGVAWAAWAGAAAVFLWVMTQVWAALPEMNDRFLIPAASGWLMWRNRPRWRATPSRPAILGFGLVLAAVILAPLGWFLLVQVGARPVLLWWLLSALNLAAFGLLVMQAGWRKAWQAAFPLAFCYLALPAPGKLQGPLQMQLKEYTTRAAVAALPWLGIPTERHGHTLQLPSGRLGVVDACSGVRSVTALTAIALLVSYLRGFSLLRTALLVAATMAIVVVSNSVRVIVTGALQEWVGVELTQGWAHDLLGYLVILVGLALIVCVSSLLVGKAPVESPSAPADSESRPARGGAAAALVLATSLAACLWTEQFRSDHRAAMRLDSLPMQLGDWTGRDAPVPPMVEDLLKCDQIVHRVYEGPLGQEFSLYVMFWATPLSTAHLHHPDICMTCQGWTIETSRVRHVSIGEGRQPIPISVRTYRQGSARTLVFYWSQAGREVLPDGVEESAANSGFGWIVTMLSGRASLERTSRLSVRLEMDAGMTSERSEALLAEICPVVAQAIYSLCPWAVPGQ